MDVTDEQLLAAWQQGDDAAFAALFARCYLRVYRAAYALLRDDVAADDAAQEAFIALSQQPPANAPILPWLCRVAINRALNALRSANRAAQRLPKLYEPEYAPDPVLLAERAADVAAVRAVLAQLPERQAQILALRHAGLAYAEIAAALDIAPSSVGTLLARAERAFTTTYETANGVLL